VVSGMLAAFDVDEVSEAVEWTAGNKDTVVVVVLVVDGVVVVTVGDVVVVVVVDVVVVRFEEATNKHKQTQPTVVNQPMLRLNE